MAQAAGKRIIVLGGGLSGLSYLHYLKRFAKAKSKSHLLSNVTLIEANAYLGGSVKTRVFDDGIVHEQGPRGVRAKGYKSQNTITLIEELGLSDQLIHMDAKSASRFIYKDGRLHMLPRSPIDLFSKLPGANSRYSSALIKELFTNNLDISRYRYKDPPFYDFIKYTFGEDAAECIADPMLRGITSGDARNLSTKALFGDLLDKYELYGSIVKSFGKMGSMARATDEFFPNDVHESQLIKEMSKRPNTGYNLKTGLQTLPEYLCYSALDNNDDGLVTVHNQTKVSGIKFRAENEPGEPPCAVEVLTIDGHTVTLEADLIVSTIPSANLTEALPDTMPSYQRVALDYITTIPHAPVGCVTIEYRDWREVKPSAIDSFGLLTHSKEGRRVLGISFDSTMFPTIDQEHKSTRMTAMIGGAWFKEMVGTDNVDEVTDARLEQIALEEVEKILGIKKEPYRMSTLLWKTGIAQYRPGHVDRMQETREKIKQSSLPITLLGQSYDGVAINDVIFEARLAADALVKSL